MAKPETEHADVIALEDASWQLKDLAADFYGRLTLTGPDRAALIGATRDVNRIIERLRAVRDKRKRKDAPDDGDAAEGSEPNTTAATSADGQAPA